MSHYHPLFAENICFTIFGTFLIHMFAEYTSLFFMATAIIFVMTTHYAPAFRAIPYCLHHMRLVHIP